MNWEGVSLINLDRYIDEHSRSKKKKPQWHYYSQIQQAKEKNLSYKRDFFPFQFNLINRIFMVISIELIILSRENDINLLRVFKALLLLDNRNIFFLLDPSKSTMPEWKCTKKNKMNLLYFMFIVYLKSKWVWIWLKFE